MDLAIIVISVLTIPLSLWQARRDRRPVEAFDDVLSHLLLPIGLLPIALKLPATAVKIGFAIAIAILIGWGVQLIRQSLATRRKRVDAAPDGRSGAT